VEFVPLPVLEKIQAFEASGGTVLWVDTKPQAGTYVREDARVVAALKEAKIVRPADLAARITHPYAAQFNLRFQPKPDRLAVARFQREGQPMYLLVNRTEQPLKAGMTAPIASQVKIWDPSTGNITDFALPTVLEIGAFRGVVVLQGE
jgi:hypothetical protein